MLSIHALRQLGRSFLILLSLHTACFAYSFEWEPVDAELLALKAAPGDAQLPGEFIFVKETISEARRTKYSRKKIYNASHSIIKTQFTIASEAPEDARIRLIHQDGSIVELGRSAFKEELGFKTRRFKIKQWSVALPQQRDGDILEIYYTVSRLNGRGISYLPTVQSTLPIRLYQVEIDRLEFPYTVEVFNIDNPEIIDLPGKRRSLVFKNVPALIEEPYSPSSVDSNGMYFLSSREIATTSKQTKYAYKILRDEAQESKDFIRQANEIAAAGKTDEEKVYLLYDFCRAQITNYDFINTTETKLQQKERQKDGGGLWDWRPGDTLKSKAGFGRDINYLFAALVRSIGLETRMTYCGSRVESVSLAAQKHYFLVESPIAVKLGDNWQLFNPKDLYCEAGMLAPSLEGLSYLRCEKGDPVEGVVPFAPAERSRKEQSGTFTLNEEGDLEGEIVITLTGHEACELRTGAHDTPIEELTTDFTQGLVKQTPNMIITALSFENLTKLSGPVFVRFHAKIQGYAELMGEKMMFAPSLFAKSSPPIFSAPTRRLPLFFPFATTRLDAVSITLPEGYTLDLAGLPANVPDNSGTMAVKYSAGYNSKTRTLLLKRDFVLCKDGCTLFSPSIYPALKRQEELISKSDNILFACKRVSSP